MGSDGNDVCVVEANLAPTWRRQPGNLAETTTWPHLAEFNLAKAMGRRRRIFLLEATCDEYAGLHPRTHGIVSFVRIGHQCLKQDIRDDDGERP